MVSLFLVLGCDLSYIVDLLAALHELASASARTLLKLASSVRALLKPYGDTQGGLEALPMIQRVKVRASFHRCKQNLAIIQGYLQVFTWLLLRFGSLL